MQCEKGVDVAGSLLQASLTPDLAPPAPLTRKLEEHWRIWVPMWAQAERRCLYGMGCEKGAR